MRFLLLVFLAAALSAPAAALETARELAASGAARLALARVEQLQPRDSSAPRWGEWEALRLGLLVRLKQHDEALTRAAALPPKLPAAELRQCLLESARAAVAAGKAPEARGYVGRMLWQLEATAREATAAEARAARLLVIESHILERQADTAFRSMLRFEQDYRPLDAAVAERFVETLLDLKHERQAVNWLARLDEESPQRLRLQLHAGLVTPEAAVAQARARTAKGGTAGYWQVIAEAAVMQKSGTLRIESLEHVLQDGDGDERRVQALAGQLWQGYLAEAPSAANRAGLLAGDDTAWLDFASRRLGSDPVQSRMLFAHLSRHGAARDVRLGAQLQLVFSLSQSGLDRSALRLFDDGTTAAGGLDTQARYLLGNIAEARGSPAAAARFWEGIPTPPGVVAEEWRIRLAAVQWSARMPDTAVATVRALAKSGKPLPAPAVSRAIALAREMRGAGRPELAQEVLVALLPLAGRSPSRGALQVLGEIAESGGQYARAADYYLRSALADGTGDAPALQARLAAGINLARAGYKEDARAQFQWLIENARDAASREAARRELSRL
jgi:hypothetical protein